MFRLVVDADKIVFHFSFMSNDRKIDGYGLDELLCSGVVMIMLKILKKLEWQSRPPRLILLRNRRKFHVPTGQMKTMMARKMKM